MYQASVPQASLFTLLNSLRPQLMAQPTRALFKSQLSEVSVMGLYSQAHRAERRLANLHWRQLIKYANLSVRRRRRCRRGR